MEQLALELSVEQTNSDQYKEALADYIKAAGLKDVYLYYCSTTKRFSVSRYFKRETIESYKTNKIIKP